MVVLTRDLHQLLAVDHLGSGATGAVSRVTTPVRCQQVDFVAFESMVAAFVAQYRFAALRATEVRHLVVAGIWCF